MARPKKESSDARAVVFGIRLTHDERASLEARAAILGVTLTEYVRAAVLDRRVESVARAAPTASNAPAGTAHVVALNRVGVNLNQIARALNSGSDFAPDELHACLAKVNRLLDEWQEITP